MAGKLSGTAIVSGSITSTQLSTSVNNSITQGGGPKITQIQITDSSYNVLDDTAVNTSGGYIKITGTGFNVGAVVIIGSVNATSTAYVSSTTLNVQVPAQVAGTYTVYVVNTDGGTAIAVNGLTYSALPNWTTGSSLPNGVSGTPISIQLAATDATTYTLQAGSTLPTGLTLTSGGLLSGTVTVALETVYAFTVVAIDAQLQDSPRAFTITITVGDPYFYLTTLLLPGNGTNNGTNNTFIDSSTNNYTITRNGNTTQGSFSPYSLTGWSNYFDGTGDYLTVADNAALQMGSGNFTIEYWWYPNSIASYQNPIDKGYTGSGALLLQTGNGDGRIIVYASGSAVITASTAVTVNAWNHMALVRNGTSLVLYLNGVSVGSVTNSTNFNSTATLGIGATATAPGGGGVGSYPIVGYLSNLRFVKGTAVYTAAFTPPTAPLTAITNTSLLTCQSNRFVDNSTNNFAITANGDISVQSFSPFAPVASYSTSTVGGSVYFDGTGDWLSFGAQSAFDCGTSNDFCMEAWVYRVTDDFHIWGAHQATVADGFYFTCGAGGVGYPGISVYSGGGGGGGVSGNVFMPKYCWQHIVLTRQSGRMRIFQNGVLTGTTTTTYQINTDGKQVAIGGGVNFQPNMGYISQSRYINGSVPTLYQTASTTLGTQVFTPPTAPLTTTSQGATAANVKGLVTYTNGQIIDATSKNILETVGDAKISTTQSKWGGSSMYFDGISDALYISASPNFAFGTGDFTVECWIYTSETTADTFYRRIYMTDGPTGNVSGNFQITLVPTTGYVNLWDGTLDLIGTSNVCNGAWHHIAATRSGTTLRLFVDGIQEGSTTYSASVSPNSGRPRPYIGTYNGSSGDYNGYIQDLRITKGYARYTANFTPPTSAFPTL